MKSLVNSLSWLHQFLLGWALTTIALLPTIVLECR